MTEYVRITSEHLGMSDEDDEFEEDFDDDFDEGWEDDFDESE